LRFDITFKLLKMNCFHGACGAYRHKDGRLYDAMISNDSSCTGTALRIVLLNAELHRAKVGLLSTPSQTAGQVQALLEASFLSWMNILNSKPPIKAP